MNIFRDKFGWLAGFSIVGLCAVLGFFGFAVAMKLVQGLLFGGLSPEDQWLLIRSSLLAIGAGLGVPFLVWRTISLAKQTKVQEDAQISRIYFDAMSKLRFEKISQSGQLGATTGPSQVEEGIAPSLIERVGAIFALSRLFDTSSVYYWPTIETLTIFVKVAAPAPLDYLSDSDKEILREHEKCGHVAEYHAFYHDCFQVVKHLRQTIPELGWDVQAALHVIASMPKVSAKEMSEKARALFRRANIQRADLRGANLMYANLQFVRAEAADLGDSDFSHANMYWCRLDGTIMEGIDLSGANLAGAVLVGADFGGDADWFQRALSDAFGDEWTVLPDGIERPEHWVSGLENWRDTHRAWYEWRDRRGFQRWGNFSRNVRKRTRLRAFSLE